MASLGKRGHCDRHVKVQHDKFKTWAYTGGKVCTTTQISVVLTKTRFYQRAKDAIIDMQNTWMLQHELSFTLMRMFSAYEDMFYSLF
jgi:hypothetical protein